MANESLESWLVKLAAKQPTPGGGAAAALSAATAAGLVGMVSIYTTGPRWVDREKRMVEITTAAARLRERAIKLMAADAAAFGLVGEAYKLPHTTSQEIEARHASIQQALIKAVEPPVQTIALVTGLLQFAEELAEDGNPNIISDVAVAASNIRASIESAIVNIEINRHLITDKSIRRSLFSVISEASLVSDRATKLVTKIRKRIRLS